MAAGTAMPFGQAFAIAKELVRQLEPACERLKVAGSLRRQQAWVGDIEIVIEPKTVGVDLLGTLGPDVDAIRAVAMRWGPLEKNGDRYIQVNAVQYGCKIDLFLVHPPAQWGSILAIRTGPANLGQFAVMRMQKYQRFHRNGRIVLAAGARIEDDIPKDDSHLEVWPTPEEADFFAAAGLPCLPPKQRGEPAAFMPVDMPRRSE